MLDSAASENAVKRFTDACAHYRVPFVKLPPELMQKAAGKPGRMAMVMAPGGLASKVLECVGNNMEDTKI